MQHTILTRTRRGGTARRGGFTLIEVLVVIGIMVLIASIAIPMVTRARRAGVKTRVAADLQSLGVALDAYRNDFGDYPRFTPDNDDPASADFLNGAEILCLGLIGPRSANGVDTVPAGATGDAFDGDGADGPGFRTSVAPAGTAGARRQPRQYGPYIDPSKFKMADPANNSPDLKTHDPTRLVLLSFYNTPILYFPARPQKSSINVPNGYVAPIPGSPVPAGDPIRSSMWDARYGVRFFRHGQEANDDDSIDRIRVMLGDLNFNGSINLGETAAATGGYALWSAGQDDRFGPDIPATPPSTPDEIKTIRDAVEKCDDVTNFR